MDIRNFFEKEDNYYKPIRLESLLKNPYFRILKDKNPYLRDIIVDLQKSGIWKIQVTMAINFISSKDINEEQIMHSKSDNIEFTTYDNADEIIEEIFESLLSRY